MRSKVRVGRCFIGDTSNLCWSTAPRTGQRVQQARSSRGWIRHSSPASIKTASRTSRRETRQRLQEAGFLQQSRPPCWRSGQRSHAIRTPGQLKRKAYTEAGLYGGDFASPTENRVAQVSKRGKAAALSARIEVVAGGASQCEERSKFSRSLFRCHPREFRLDCEVPSIIIAAESVAAPGASAMSRRPDAPVMRGVLSHEIASGYGRHLSGCDDPARPRSAANHCCIMEFPAKRRVSS